VLLALWGLIQCDFMFLPAISINRQFMIADWRGSQKPVRA